MHHGEEKGKQPPLKKEKGGKQHHPQWEKTVKAPPPQRSSGASTATEAEERGNPPPPTRGEWRNATPPALPSLLLWVGAAPSLLGWCCFSLPSGWCCFSSSLPCVWKVWGEGGEEERRSAAGRCCAPFLSLGVLLVLFLVLRLPSSCGLCCCLSGAASLSLRWSGAALPPFFGFVVFLSPPKEKYN